MKGDLTALGVKELNYPSKISCVQFCALKILLNLCENTEATVQRCCIFLKNYQKLKENTCTGILFLTKYFSFNFVEKETPPLVFPSKSWEMFRLSFSVKQFQSTSLCLQNLIAKCFLVRVKTVKRTDERVAVTSEVMSSMKITKIYALEDSFKLLVKKLRKWV